jgi:DNA-binding GntR family transcriptional regulator
VLRHDVLAELRESILAGRLRAGDRLREVQLATTLGTSRGPVREAMRQLEQEGLVAMQPHRGATVVGVPADEVETIYELRAGLESRAMRHAVARATDEDLDALDALVAAMLAASRAGDPETVTELDIRFHARVIELAGFQYLRRLWSSVESLVRAGSVAIQGRRDVRGPDGRIRFLLEPSLEHEAIVAALRARDPEVAADQARIHVMRALERLAREQVARDGRG